MPEVIVMFAVLDAATGVAYQIVTALEAAASPLFGGASAAAAIVLLTIGIRSLLLPLSHAALRGERARVRLLPRLQELRRRHRNNPDRLRQELAALYQRERTSPFAGLLPILLQAPVLAVVYRLFLVSTVAGHPNRLLERDLFGAPLGGHWSEALTAGLFGPASLVFAALFGLLAVVAWASSRLAGRSATGSPPTGSLPAGSPPTGLALLRLLPYGTIVVAALVPFAAGMYLLASTGWSLAERAALGWWLDRADRRRPPPPRRAPRPGGR